MTTVGIIGLGSFGSFVASVLSKDQNLHIKGYDLAATVHDSGVESGSLASVSSCDIVILAVPIASYTSVLNDIRALLPADTLLIDVCSVKIRPAELFASIIPEHTNTLMLHPLFGPKSTSNGTPGHTLVVTAGRGSKAAKAVKYCEEVLGLSIVRTTADEHDKTMAQVQALTFFISKGLGTMQLPIPEFTTPSYRPIEQLLTFYASHSEELFETVQQYNPYAAATRTALLRSLETYDQYLNKTADHNSGSTRV